MTRICTVYITPSSDNMSQVVSLKYLRVLKYVHRYNSQVAELNGNFYVEHAFEQNNNLNDIYKYIFVKGIVVVI